MSPSTRRAFEQNDRKRAPILAVLKPTLRARLAASFPTRRDHERRAKRGFVPAKRVPGAYASMPNSDGCKDLCVLKTRAPCGSVGDQDRSATIELMKFAVRFGAMSPARSARPPGRGRLRVSFPLAHISPAAARSCTPCS
jgi:hypothetical protein